MKITRKIILLFAALLFMPFTSCAADDIVEVIVSPDIEADTAETFVKVLASADNRLKITTGRSKTGNRDNGGISIQVLLQLEGKNAYADFFASAAPDQGNNTALKTAAGKRIYAPYTVFYDPSISATSKEILEGKFRIKQIDEITLPEKALAVDGRYPDSTAYPLVVNVTALFPQYGENNKIDQKIESLKAALVSYYSFQGDFDAYAGPAGAVTWISFTGDIMPLRGVDRQLMTGERRGLEKVFGGTLDILQRSGIAIGNLETAVTDLGSGSKLDKSYNFKIPYQILPRLKEAGYDYLMITNNHSFDYGIEGFRDTLLNLKKAGIATSGAGLDKNEAIAPWSTEIDGRKINIFSLSDYPPEKLFQGRIETEAGEDRPGTAWYSDEFLSSLKNSSGKNSIDIVCVHGGFEWSSAPAASQKELFRKLAENGADIVAGSHPHVLQPLEVSGSSLIAYSTGNFVFPGMEETKYGEESVILETGWYGSEIKYINIHPVKISGAEIDLDKSGKITERFLKMNRTWNAK
ncbi:MAG: CapA family protein [Spirochaetales bacterium]|nr:CapA family protein [Spirochaetales bacterium]